MTSLFIDDIRVPEDCGFKSEDFMIARNPHQAKILIRAHKPQVISFDHDLGLDDDGNEYQSGYDIAKWMVFEDSEQGLDLFTEDFIFYCHSANPVGKENIEKLLYNYLEHKHERIG